MVWCGDSEVGCSVMLYICNGMVCCFTLQLSFSFYACVLVSYLIKLSIKNTSHTSVMDRINRNSNMKDIKKWIYKARENFLCFKEEKKNRVSGLTSKLYRKIKNALQIVGTIIKFCSKNYFA